MIEWAQQHGRVEIDPVAYYRLLGYPLGVEPGERALELAEWAVAWYAEQGRGWTYAREAASVAWRDGAVVVDGVALHARRLHKLLAQTHAAGGVLVAASAGPALEAEAARCWRDERPDEYFFLETLGSAVVERLVMDAGARLCAWAEERGLSVLPHDGPGYAGWDVGEQPRLLSLLSTGRRVDWPGPLESLESGALRPKKSQLAVFGLAPRSENEIARAALVPCHNCPAASCQYRRAPYRLAAASCRTPKRP